MSYRGGPCSQTVHYDKHFLSSSSILHHGKSGGLAMAQILTAWDFRKELGDDTPALLVYEYQHGTTHGGPGAD